MEQIDEMVEVVAQDRTYSAWRMFLSCLFTAVLLVGSVLTVKVISVGPLALPGGAFIFPLTFCILTVVSEVYGLPVSWRLATIGVLILAGTIILFDIVALFPTIPPASHKASEFQDLFGAPPRAFAAVLLGFSMGQVAQLALMAWAAYHLKGRLLFLRLCGGPLLAQAMTTAVALPIVFAGQLPAYDLLSLIYGRIVYAVAYSVLAMLPIYYLARYIRRQEGPHMLPTVKYPDDVRAQA